MFTTIVTTVISTLVAGGILAAVRTRWLYVIAPKLYLTTPLSDGEVVSLSVFNAGFSAEEDVAITFRQSCHFELIATSKSTQMTTGKTISLPKLARFETVTILLLIEGKSFESSDIESVESKLTKGRVVESKDKATGLYQHFIVWPILLILMGLPFVAGMYTGAMIKVSPTTYIREKFDFGGVTKQLAGFKQNLRANYSLGSLSGSLSDDRVKLTIQEIVRRDDILTLSVEIKNNTIEPLLVEAYFESSAGDQGPLDFGDSRAKKFAIPEGEGKAITVKVFLPESLPVKMIDGTYSFENLSGGSMNAHQIIRFDSPGSN